MNYIGEQPEIVNLSGYNLTIDLMFEAEKEITMNNGIITNSITRKSRLSKIAILKADDAKEDAKEE